VLQQWKPVSGLKRVDSRAAVIEGVTGSLANQRLMDADKVALIVSIKTVDNPISKVSKMY
jgi:hypothetical protein